jgi:hypothetical protein
MLMTAKREQPETTEASRERPLMLIYQRPICPAHAVPMFCGSSPAGVRHFYCPVDGCKESQKVAK